MESFEMFKDKAIDPDEMAALMASVGWGKREDYSREDILLSLQNMPFVAYIRDADKTLVAYVSAFSDEAFSTFVSELVVHPRCQNKNLGTELLQAVERRYPDVPVYIKPFEDSVDFFLKRGYKEPKRKTVALSKRNRA